MTASSVLPIQISNSFLGTQMKVHKKNSHVRCSHSTSPNLPSSWSVKHISRLLWVFVCSCCIWSDATALSLAEAHLFNRTSHFSTHSFSCSWSDPHRSSLNEPVRQDNPTPYYKHCNNIPATWLRGRWQGRVGGVKWQECHIEMDP